MPPVASADALTKLKPILAKTTLIERDPEYVLSLQYLSRFSLTDDERFLGLAHLSLDLHTVSG